MVRVQEGVAGLDHEAVLIDLYLHMKLVARHALIVRVVADAVKLAELAGDL